MEFLKRLLNRKQLEFIKDDLGLHQIGGNIPKDFIIPKNEFKGGIQYLGVINNLDKHFEWLPVSMHLICPIFTDFDYFFVYYGDPKAPEIIYPTDSADITTAYDELSESSYVIYNEAKFSLRSFGGINEDNEFEIIGVSGEPHWIQSSDFPTCPKLMKKMRFVCQLFSNSPVTAKDKNFKSNDEYYEKIFTELNFWCDGDLKVFFEPSSKVACYFIQNS